MFSSLLIDKGIWQSAEAMEDNMSVSLNEWKKALLIISVAYPRLHQSIYQQKKTKLEDSILDIDE
jgi:hypothetical protein